MLLGTKGDKRGKRGKSPPGGGALKRKKDPKADEGKKGKEEKKDERKDDKKADGKAGEFNTPHSLDLLISWRTKYYDDGGDRNLVWIML